MISVACFTRMMGLILGDFLGEVQMNVSAQEIVNTSPFRTTVRKFLHETATKVLTLMRINSSGVKITFPVMEPIREEHIT